MPSTWYAFFLAAMWLSQAQADTTAKASNSKAQATAMTNQEASKIYEQYIACWKAIPDDQRTRLAAEVIAENVEYSTPRHESGGRKTIIEDMAAFQNKFPGGHFELGDVSAHHDVALLTWVLVQADGKIFAKGHDQIRVSPEGKIVSLITFAPSVAKP